MNIIQNIQNTYKYLYKAQAHEVGNTLPQLMREGRWESKRKGNPQKLEGFDN